VIGQCRAEGCDRASRSLGLCFKHYAASRYVKRPIRFHGTHGMHNTNVYHRWEGMNQRCHNPKHDRYPSYGGRGITVCAEWRHSFENFYKDMGALPSPRHQIDRIDGSKGYCKENCRWVLPIQNAHNRKTTRLNYEIGARMRADKSNGESIKEIAIKYGFPESTIKPVLRGERW
jgi:hypothetical protein